MSPTQPPDQERESDAPADARPGDPTRPAAPARRGLLAGLRDGPGGKPGALRRLGGAAHRVLTHRIRPLVDEKVAPALQKGARVAMLQLAKPQNARMLQSTLASLAQRAIDGGFEVDPQARLFFEFVDTLEKTHSRERVLKIVSQHALRYEYELLGVLLSGLQNPSGAKNTFEPGAGEHLGDELLELLCELAALESEAPPPLTREARLAYFEAAPIDSRFKILGRMAAGDPAAFTGSVQTDSAAARATETKSGLPARFFPSLNDPAIRFRTTSQLLFLHTYLLRAMIESLPDVLATLAELDQDAERLAADVLDIKEDKNTPHDQ